MVRWQHQPAVDALPGLEDGDFHEVRPYPAVSLAGRCRRPSSQALRILRQSVTSATSPSIPTCADACRHQAAETKRQQQEQQHSAPP